MLAQGNFNLRRSFMSTKQSALSDDMLRSKAPSIFAETPWETMTDKYLFVPTIHVVNLMRDNGMVPVRAMQSRSRIEGKSDFTKHLVAFRDITKEAKVGELVQEIILVNSHDGTSSYQLHCGLFRWVCLNGLMVADSTIDSIKCRHSKKVMDDIIEGTHTLIREAPAVIEKVEMFKMITLTWEEQRALAEAAMMQRFELEGHSPIEPQQLLNIRRDEDRQPSLWNVYNRIEENMMKGGLTGRTASNRNTTTRAVKSVGETVRMEKALWHLTDFFARQKVGQ